MLRYFSASDQVDTSIFITSCRNFTHNGSITWFLIGCLATRCVINITISIQNFQKNFFGKKAVY